jgi:hypothetical protein
MSTSCLAQDAAKQFDCRDQVVQAGELCGRSATKVTGVKDRGFKSSTEWDVEGDLHRAPASLLTDDKLMQVQVAVS